MTRHGRMIPNSCLLSRGAKPTRSLHRREQPTTASDAGHAIQVDQLEEARKGHRDTPVGGARTEDVGGPLLCQWAHARIRRRWLALAMGGRSRGTPVAGSAVPHSTPTAGHWLAGSGTARVGVVPLARNSRVLVR